MQLYHHREPFALESGDVFNELTIAYHTYGTMNSDGSNVIWICHALTANSDPVDWWHGVVGADKVIDPKRYFIVCANILGSCYGTTGPLSVNQSTQRPYYNSFPLVTIRDMVNAHIVLRKHLNISRIALLMGGSMGGYQVLEWSVIEPSVIDKLFILATSAAESAWGMAIHTAQRLAIEADGTWGMPDDNAGAKGLKAARAIGMLTYRNYTIMVKKQTDEDNEKVDDFKVSAYINHQGDKLVSRFNAYSYHTLTRSLDSHNLSRGRGKSIDQILEGIQQQTLIIGISSDILCPVIEQKFLSRHIPNSELIEIDSSYGHDGFLVESAIISRHLSEWLGDEYILGYGASI